MLGGKQTFQTPEHVERSEAGYGGPKRMVDLLRRVRAPKYSAFRSYGTNYRVCVGPLAGRVDS